MIGIYLLAWLPMVFLAIANGLARDRGYQRFVGELRAHQLSTLSAAILFTGYTWAINLRWPLAGSRQALAVGLMWVLLTIAFEIGFGHFVAHLTWRRLAMDYDLRTGRVWPLLLAWLLVLPYLVHRLSA